jgi:glycosyltransferase involved in cell wall biosynthesis
MKKKKKVAIVGSVGLPANYGGFETMVYYLTAQKNAEIDFTVFCEKTPNQNKLDNFNGSKLKYLPFKANGTQSIIYDITAICFSWFKYDSILILGTPGCLILPFLSLFKKTKTIVNFGGLEWKREKWGKFGQWYLKTTEKVGIKYSSVVVADNQYFCEYIRDEYKIDSNLIEYGGDHVISSLKTDKFKQRYPFLDKPYDVSVSRAQEDNNLHMVLEAYKTTPNRNIVLVSNYDKFEYGRLLKKEFSKYPNIFMQDAVYNQQELDLIRSNASLYIHSHKYCGTAPSLVEAMNLSLGVVSFDMPTNRNTTEGKAYYFNSSSSLSQLLKKLTPAESLTLSQDMKEIATRRYTWVRISEKYATLF